MRNNQKNSVAFYVEYLLDSSPAASSTRQEGRPLLISCAAKRIANIL